MTYRQALREADKVRHAALRSYWLGLIETHKWNYAHVAKAAGVERVKLYGLLKRAGISRPKKPKPSIPRRAPGLSTMYVETAFAGPIKVGGTAPGN